MLAFALRMRTETEDRVLDTAPVVKDCACQVLPSAVAHGPSVVIE